MDKKQSAVLRRCTETLYIVHVENSPQEVLFQVTLLPSQLFGGSEVWKRFAKSTGQEKKKHFALKLKKKVRKDDPCDRRLYAGCLGHLEHHKMRNKNSIVSRGRLIGRKMAEENIGNLSQKAAHTHGPLRIKKGTPGVSPRNIFILGQILSYSSATSNPRTHLFILNTIYSARVYSFVHSLEKRKCYARLRFWPQRLSSRALRWRLRKEETF